jgi:uncharacterized protein
MTFQNPSAEAIASLLTSARTIAVIGLSGNPLRPSYDVAHSLLAFGYKIVPVNPSLGSWGDIPAHATLKEATGEERIDIVNVFRQSRFVSAIVDDCLRLELPALWLQLGVIDVDAAQRARSAGMSVVMNKCLKIERLRMG